VGCIRITRSANSAACNPVGVARPGFTFMTSHARVGTCPSAILYALHSCGKMAIYDSQRGGYRIFVGDLGPRVGKIELKQEFERYGIITDVWIAKYVELGLT